MQFRCEFQRTSVVMDIVLHTYMEANMCLDIPHVSEHVLRTCLGHMYMELHSD